MIRNNNCGQTTVFFLHNLKNGLRWNMRLSAAESIFCRFEKRILLTQVTQTDPK